MQQHNPPTDIIPYDGNAIKAILAAAKRLAPRERAERRRRGRPPKYETWKLAALCAIKAPLNITFKRTAELAPLIVGASPSPATIHRARVKLKDWAMEAAAKAAGNPDLLVADSTGIPHRRKGRHFKIHFLYDVRSDLVIAATATPGPTADYQGYQKLLHSVPEKSVVLADSAYFGRSNFEKTLERDALLLAKPRRPPRRGRRRGWAAKYERIFEALRHLYRHRSEGERFCSRLK
ncbi:MAG: transposase, partial [Candidatus Baldrarchaeia archaeon]